MAHLHIPVATAEEDNIVRWLSALSLQRAAAGCILAIPNIRDVIIPHCTPATLIRLSWTCRTLYQVIQDYFTLAYNINEHLRPFFDDPIGFRSLQARTGALISGSNALQFFAQVRYEESDLDIYVKSSKVLEVGNWLMNSAGYRFEPNGTASNQAPGTTFVQAVLDEDNDWEYAHDHPEGVYTFYKVALWPEAGLRKVQVVSAIDTPMALILKFYSSQLFKLSFLV